MTGISIKIFHFIPFFFFLPNRSQLRATSKNVAFLCGSHTTLNIYILGSMINWWRWWCILLKRKTKRRRKENNERFRRRACFRLEHFCRGQKMKKELQSYELFWGYSFFIPTETRKKRITLRSNWRRERKRAAFLTGVTLSARTSLLRSARFKNLLERSVPYEITCVIRLHWLVIRFPGTHTSAPPLASRRLPVLHNSQTGPSGKCYHYPHFLYICVELRDRYAVRHASLARWATGRFGRRIDPSIMVRTHVSGIVLKWWWRLACGALRSWRENTLWRMTSPTPYSREEKPEKINLFRNPVTGCHRGWSLKSARMSRRQLT